MDYLEPNQIAPILKELGARFARSAGSQALMNHGYYQLWLPVENIPAYLTWVALRDKAEGQECECDISAYTNYFSQYYGDCDTNPLHEEGTMFTCYRHRPLILQALKLITQEET